MYKYSELIVVFFFFQAEDGIRDIGVTGVQTCALPILVVNLLLGIVRNLHSRTEFAVGYGAIHVRYAAHAKYLYQGGHGPLGRRSLRYVIDRLPRLHDTFIGVVERSVIPWRIQEVMIVVISRVVPCLVGSEITGKEVTFQGLRYLIFSSHVLSENENTTLHLREIGAGIEVIVA